METVNVIDVRHGPDRSSCRPVSGPKEILFFLLAKNFSSPSFVCGTVGQDEPRRLCVTHIFFTCEGGAVMSTRGASSLFP